MFSAVASLLAFSSVPSSSTPALDVYRLVRVEASELVGRPRLLSTLGFDHVGHDAGGAVELPASAEQLAGLEAQGVQYEVLVDDLASWYASRMTGSPEGTPQYGAWLSPAFGSGSMGGYYTYSQVVSVLDQIHAAYPTLTTAKASIGTSVEGRTLWMLKVSDNASVDENEPEVRIDALHHAREPEGMQASLWFVLFLLESYNTDPLAKYLVDNREIYFVPVVNPDGYVYNQTTNPGGGGMWRKNRRNNGGGSFGIDLNRNYADHWGFDNTGSSPTPSSDTYRGPAAASEPEIQAIQAFNQAHQFASSLSIHTYSNLWLYPYGYAAIYPANNAQYVEVSNLATAVNHYEVGPPAFILYTANGCSADYEHDAVGTMAWSPEIGSNSDGFWPPTNRIVPLAEENLLGVQCTALAGGAWMRVLSKTVSEVGDGDGFYEPGEGVNIAATVRNSGRATTATNVVVTLTSTSPYVTITNGTYNAGALAGFTQATSPQLSFSLAANTPPGAAVDYTLTVTYEGWSQSETSSLPIGKPIPFVIDDSEIDWGWTKGVAGDTATTGIWTRGSPIGTSSSGQAASPSQDTTPTPGVQCYLTGNGGGSAGTDDVDNGATTLLSPIFDLSNCGPAKLSFSRWFADLTAADDTLAISISNNGGGSWTSLQNITGNNNAWASSSFDVPSFVAQTASMRLRFVAADTGTGSVVEAAIDDLKVEIYDAAPKLNVYGKPTGGATVRANLTGPAGATYALRATITDPNTGGTTPTIPHARTIVVGTIPASQLAQISVTLPSGAAWTGHTIWYRGVVAAGAGKQLSNWAAVTVQ